MASALATHASEISHLRDHFAINALAYECDERTAWWSRALTALQEVNDIDVTTTPESRLSKRRAKTFLSEHAEDVAIDKTCTTSLRCGPSYFVNARLSRAPTNTLICRRVSVKEGRRKVEVQQNGRSFLFLFFYSHWLIFIFCDFSPLTRTSPQCEFGDGDRAAHCGLKKPGWGRIINHKCYALKMTNCIEFIVVDGFCNYLFMPVFYDP